MFFTVKAWNFEDQAVLLSGFVEDENGTVVKSVGGFIGRLPANAKNYTLTAFSLDVYGVGNHTYNLFLDNYDGKPNSAGEEHWSEVRVEVNPPTVQKASMDCSNMVLSAKKGNLVLDMTCDVYFTNPTNVSWKVTRVDIDPSRILETQRTKDVTIGIPTETIVTRTVAPRGIGEFKLDFQGVLSSSNLLKTGWDLKDLAGFKVPVQVNFTVYDNGHPYVVTSNGNILGLGYSTTQQVGIMINEKTVTEHIIGDIVSGVVIGLISARAGAKIGAIIGTAVEPGAGTAAGTVVGGIVGEVLGFIAGFTMHEKLGWP